MLIVIFATSTTTLAAPAGQPGPTPPSITVFDINLMQAVEPVFLDNGAGSWPPNTVPFILRPEAYELGDWSAVRFEYPGELWVQEFSFLAPNVQSGEATCTVDQPRIFELYTAPGTVPPANEMPDLTLVVPGIPNAANTVVQFVVELERILVVEEGENLFITMKHDGTWPDDINCLLLGSKNQPDRVEEEFWSNETDPPYAWTGLETFQIPQKTLMQVQGVSPVFPF